MTIQSRSDFIQDSKAQIIPIVERKFGLKVRLLKEKLDAESLIGGFIITANK